MMLVTRVVTPNVFEPFERQIETVYFNREGPVALRDVLPEFWDAPLEETIAFVNGSREDSWDREIADCDVVHLIANVADPVSIVLVIVAVVAAAAAIIAINNLPETPPAPNPDGSSTYGYYGFQNAFRAEGDPLPIVYGKMRMAPPVINQIIVSVGADRFLGVARREAMNLLFAISEGPINGLGRFIGQVETDADLLTLTALNGSKKKGTGLEINGISAQNFVGDIGWRTGTLNQNAVSGTLGFAGLNEVAATYALDVTPPNGTEGLTESNYPTGAYPPGDPNLIDQPDEAEYVSQNILVRADKAIVQIDFKRGLWKQNTSTGNLDARSNTIRIQYRETDSAGIGLGDYVLLPEYRITGSSNAPLSTDIPVSFVDPGDYAPSTSRNSSFFSSSLGYHLFNTNSSGHTRITPTIGGALNPKFSIGTWIRPRSWANGDGYSKWIWFASTAGATYGSATSSGYLSGIRPASGTTLGGSGWSLRITKNFWGELGEPTTAVFAVLESWRAGDLVTPGGGGITQHYAKIGDIADFPTSGLISNQWFHIAARYDGDLTNGARVVFTVNGVSHFVAETRTENGGSITLQWPNGGDWYIGALDGKTTAFDSEQTLCNLSELFIYDGLISDDDLAEVGGPYVGVDELGNKVVGLSEVLLGDPQLKLALPMNSRYSISGPTYLTENIVYDTEQGADYGDFTLTSTAILPTPKQDGPIWDSSAATPKLSYWLVEVYVGEQINESNENNEATVSSIVALTDQTYTYPGTAVASVSIQADDQVNNQQPGVTFLVEGKLVKTWDGTLDPDGKPVYATEWTRNPAWIAADLLTSKVYGLGNDVPGSDADESIDWPSFLEWARFCDEGTADAFGEVNIFGLAHNAANDYIELYVGLRTTAGAAAETIPESWRPYDFSTSQSQSFVSITGVTAGGLSEDWITANDSATGLNEASNQLGILSFEQFNNPSGFHGYEDYTRILVFWNRDEYPIAGTFALYADDLGLSTLATVSGYEPRCRFDGVFDQKDQSGWEAVLQIFQAGRAMPVKAGRKVYAVVDKPRPVVAVFNQGNVVTDSLEITYRGPFATPNSLEGDILDELSNYQRRTILVDHPSIQDATQFDSFRKERVELRGVTRVSQAIRDCTYRLNRYYLVRRSVTFEVGPDAVNLLPGDRFRLAHDVPQYGFSGRLRDDATVYNFFPRSGSLYSSWDKQGGPCAISAAALIFEDAVTSTPINSSVKVSEFVALPAAPGGAGPASIQGLSGSDLSNAATPFWATQHITTANTLYPPTEVFGPLTQIDATDYECCFSIYTKEAALGSAEFLRLSVYRYADSDGTLIDSSNYADFAWSSGALSSTGSSSGITATATSIGSGWYRIAVGYDNSVVGGAVGDYLQARLYLYDTSGSFLPVADGGKGTNFLEFGDPLNINNLTIGTTYSGTNWFCPALGPDAPTTTTVAPPFYTATDGTYGSVIRLAATNSAGTKFASHLGQAVGLTTGSGVATWNGQVITLTGYARIGANNTATTTDLYIDLRFASTRNSTTKLLIGDGIRATLRYTGGAWAFVGTPVKTQASGTVGVAINSVNAVRQNSTTNDANWVRFDVSVSYTPTVGSFSTIYAELASYNAAYATTASVDVWGLRLHGRSSSGQTVNPYYHRRGLFWGGMFEEGALTPSTYRPGSSIRLDRDVTLEAGKSYEVLIRSSFAPDSAQGFDNSETVVVDAAQVPGSGSTVVAANSLLFVDTPRRFTPHTGDLYSFGEVGQSAEDFIVTRIDLDPGTMHRIIEGEEYDAQVYNDTTFGGLGAPTISALADPSAAAQSAQFGVGLGSEGYGLRSFQFRVQEETIADERGGGQPRLFFSWTWPAGVQIARRMHLYICEESDTLTALECPMIKVGTCDAAQGYFEYDGPLLKRGVTYRVTFQPEGSGGAAMPLKACPFRRVQIRKIMNPATLGAPVVTTTTRGFQQLYELERIRNSRMVEVVEGRIGGWKLGTPAFVIDPDVANTASDTTLVGQLSTSSGKVNMQVVCRGRTDLGHYGQASIVFGDEQLKDVTYSYSTATDNDYASAGFVSTELQTTGGVMQFKSSSTALTADYFPNEIDLGTAKRVLVNFTVEATQVRPETLADLPYALNSEKIRRWSFEGPMDDLDGDDAELILDWKWSSTASTGSETYRAFRPGEVYARKLTFRVTFKRPTTAYNIRMTRCLVQALEVPAYDPADVDGGTY